jgi:hypothetical protein
MKPLPSNLNECGTYHGVEIYTLEETGIRCARSFRMEMARRWAQNEPTEALVLTASEYAALREDLGSIAVAP